MQTDELANISDSIDTTIVVFISGEGTNLQAIIDATTTGVLLNSKITLVVSNNKTAPGLKRAKKAGIPTKIMLYDSNTDNRHDYDMKLKEIILDEAPTITVLAGWMHILSKDFLNMPYRVINIHPALPEMFPGTNAIQKAFDAYQRGNIKRTGIMIHEVVEKIDAGKILEVIKVPIYPQDTIETLTARIKYHEKPLLITCLINELARESRFRKGKVRDILDLGYDNLIMIHTNRLSSFDRHICDIEWKGFVLNKTSLWWFEQTRHIVPNHFIYSNSHIMIVKKCIPFKIEVVVRGYITGNTKTSLWTHYNNGERNYCGIDFPDGLVKNQKLSQNVITPTTKGIVDKPMSSEALISEGYVSPDDWEYISEVALELFAYGQKVAAKRGLILVDTKYEFGRDVNDKILLIDELHTCDSSRYWLKNTYTKRFKAGKEPDKLDKDLIRDYVRSKCDPYNDTIPKIPRRIKNKVRNAYISFYEKLTKQPNEHLKWKNKTLLEVCCRYFKHELNEFVIILSGSDSDSEFVERLKYIFKENNIYATDYVLSAHRNTSKLVELLRYYEAPYILDDTSGTNINRLRQKKRKRIVYVTVAGRSNALSGVVACNSTYPVIACPPFKDKSDMLVNIQSSLQMPRNVPVMTILEPLNVVSAVQRIFSM